MFLAAVLPYYTSFACPTCGQTCASCDREAERIARIERALRTAGERARRIEEMNEELWRKVRNM
jgi:hypothetical protein